MIRLFSGKKHATPGLLPPITKTKASIDESDRTEATVDISDRSASGSEQVVDEEWSRRSTLSTVSDDEECQHRRAEDGLGDGRCPIHPFVRLVDDLRCQFRRYSRDDDADDESPIVAGPTSTEASSSSASEGKRVRFIDEISNSFAPANNIRRSASVVTQIQTRPYTTPSEKRALFYSRNDIREFRSRTTLEIIIERATRGGDAVAYSSQSYVSYARSSDCCCKEGNKGIENEGVEGEEEEDVKDTRLLHRLLFDNHDDVVNDSDDRLMTLQSRKRRGVRQILHREAVLYHM